MTSTSSQDGLVLGLLLGGVGKALRKEPDDPHVLTDIAVYADQARKAEAAKLHTIFLADTVTVNEKSPTPGLEPVTLLSALAAVTERIGLIGSVSTSFTEPYNVARQIASLDQISRGRGGWNLVTSAWGEENFGVVLPAHDERYAIATEFAEIVTRLWESWDHDAISYDGDHGVQVDPARVHRINWESDHFQVRGPLNIPRSPQNRPILAQAGSSDAGKELGARFADVIFTTGLVDIEPSIELYNDIKARARAHGRHPDAVKILPGVAPIIGSTDEEAYRFWRESHEHFDFEAGRQALAGQFGGVSFDGYDLDAPIPVHILPEIDDVQGRRSRYEVVRRLIDKGHLTTVRDVILYHASAAGHWFPVGSVENIADQFEERWRRGAADGFNILAFVLNYPWGLEAITEHLVPELQRRGIFHTDYEHETLRDNLGLTSDALAAAV